MKIPKKYEERFCKLQKEEDLIDNCNYILYFNNGWSWDGYESVPVKSKKEALKFIKEAEKGE